MSLERITIKLPPGFDPNTHAKALEQLIANQYGAGFELDSIDIIGGTATASRQAAITEVKAQNAGKKSQSFDVKLARGTKVADGDKTAARLEDQYDGYTMTSFEPFIGKATLTHLSDDELRCRGALSVALGCKPWDVQVTSRVDGGFSIGLPRTYQPSKEAKIQEVAESVVGTEGWYANVDAKKLHAEIIPGTPPTFPGAIPFPLGQLRNAPRDKVQLGWKLGRPGGPGDEVLWLDFDAAPHTMISGTSGSGKAEALDNLIPVPVSDNFPNGWARVRDLRAGDRLYGADGATIELLGLSDTLRLDLHDVYLSDGQVIRVAGDHLWRASSGAQRNNLSQVDPDPKHGRMAWAQALRDMAARIQPGTYARTAEIGEMTGYTPGWVDSVIRRHDISHEDVYDTKAMPIRRKTTSVAHFASDEALIALAKAGKGTRLDARLFVGDWRTARDIAFLTGVGNSKDAATKVRRLLRRHLVSEKQIEIVVESAPHDRVAKVRLHPVAEVLSLLAEEHMRNYASGGIHDVKPHFSVISTTDMATEMTYAASGGKNWSIEVPVAFAGENAEDLPLDPYWLGCWLGDGTSRTSSITVGPQDLAEVGERLGAIYPITRREAHTASKVVTLHFGRTNRERCVKDHDNRSEKAHTRYCRTCRTPEGEAHAKVNNGPQSELRRLGLIHNKHIPAVYLRAPVAVRLAVLQGLMDTDGTVDENGSCELTLTNVRLINHAIELIRSLGIKASMTSSPAAITENGVRRVVGTRWRIHFTTNRQVFRLARKAARLPVTVRSTQSRLYVERIEPVGKGLARCLRVSAPDGMYLTAGFVQTHNSVSLNAILAGALAGRVEVCVLDVAHKAVDFYWMRDLCRPGGWGCDSLRHTVAAITMLYKEGERRAKVIADHGVTKWTELPKSAQFAPILCLIDEVTALIQLDDVPKGLPKDHPLVTEAQEANLLRQTLLGYMKKIAAEMRFVGIRLILSSQVSSTTTGVPTALRMNLANKFLLGSNPTPNNRRLSLNDATSVPEVPEHVKRDDKASRGVGVAEMEAQVPSVFKSYYASTDNYRKALDELGLSTTNKWAPTPADVARYTPSLDDDLGGGRGGNEPRGERAPSGKLASQVAAEMGDSYGVSLHDGSLGSDPFARANAARHAATQAPKVSKAAKPEVAADDNW